MPRHVLTLLVVTAAFFGLLWFGVVILDQTPGKALVLSFITLFLLGIGVTFSAATLGEDRGERD